MELMEGTDYQATFVYEDNLGFPIDLTSYSVDMKVRAYMEEFSGYNMSLPKLALSTEFDLNGSGIVLGGTSGEITVQISGISTQQLDWSRAVYDINLISPEDKITRFLGGFVTILANSAKQPFTRQSIAYADPSGIPVGEVVVPELVPGLLPDGYVP